MISAVRRGLKARNLEALLFVFMQSLLIAVNLVVGRALLVAFPPLLFRLFQFTTSALILLALSFARRDLRLPAQPGMWLKAGLYGVIGTVLPLSALILGMQYLSSGVMSLFMIISPVFIVLLAHYLLPDEHLTRRKSLGVLLAFCGTGLVLMRGENGLAEVAQADPRGYIWGFVSAAGVSAAIIYPRIYLQNKPSFEVTSANIVTSALVMVPIVFLSGSFDFSRVTLPGLGAVIFTGCVMVFSLWLGFIVVQRFGATAESQVSYITPTLTLTLGTLFLNEQVTFTILAGIALVFLGLRFLNR